MMAQGWIPCSLDRDSMSSPCHALGWGLTCYA